MTHGRPTVDASPTASAAVWDLREGRLTVDRPIILGILNVTPDSFSDGGRFVDAGAAMEIPAVTTSLSKTKSVAEGLESQNFQLEKLPTHPAPIRTKARSIIVREKIFAFIILDNCCGNKN